MRFLTIIGIGALVLVLGWVAWSLWYADGTEDPVETPDSSPGLPIGSSSAPPTTPPVTPSEPSGYRAQQTDGTTVPVDSLVAHRSTEQRAADFYRTTFDPDVYAIYYNSNAQTIWIDLYSTPLSEARRLAEAHLQEVLGMSESGVCRLDISVTTNTFVEPAYADQNLGLSYCANAVTLP